ncbi:hypothetical protein K7432_003365 [Basidiobolus ranarum]|uniref:Yeast cell wall synthesis Kre9/Knh1-like N-terminal domain-containing protein n=1 Tax=Basidiobolus ranarum TaxID=34480 RepID=A0ABR2WZZ8_9FUNG
MLRQSAQLLIAATLLGYATVDATLAFTAPLEVEWKAGSKHIITWIDNGDGKGMPETADLDLMNGNPTALQLVANIASGVSTASGSYEWTVPTDLEAGKYALRAGGGSGSYSPFFTIAEPNADTTTSTEPTATTDSSTSKSYAKTVTVTVTADKPISSTSIASVSSASSIDSSASASASASVSSASSAASASSASSASSVASGSSIIASATSALESVSSSVASVISSVESEIASTSSTEAIPTETTTTESQNGVGQIIPSTLIVSVAMIFGYISTIV